MRKNYGSWIMTDRKRLDRFKLDFLRESESLRRKPENLDDPELASKCEKPDTRTE